MMPDNGDVYLKIVSRRDAISPLLHSGGSTSSSSETRTAAFNNDSEVSTPANATDAGTASGVVLTTSNGTQLVLGDAAISASGTAKGSLTVGSIVVVSLEVGVYGLARDKVNNVRLHGNIRGFTLVQFMEAPDDQSELMARKHFSALHDCWLCVLHAHVGCMFRSRWGWG